MRLSAVRNRNLSLWQSVIGEMADRISKGDPKVAQAIQVAASLHASAAAAGKTLPEPAVAPETANSDPAALAYISALVFDMAQALQRGDAIAEFQAANKLRELLVRAYSTLDLVGWTQCALRWGQYYIAAHRMPPYRDWNQQSPADMNFGVIDYALPSTAKVLMLGDWGTRMADNVAMLRAGLTKWKPDAIIHLGDVYYSGTKYECEQNVLDVMDKLVSELGIQRPPFFTIPGNHEYYSGGVGYFDMIDRVNSGIAGALQRASYFCLRTADNVWQFLGMDTGYNDRDPIKHVAPDLQTSEIKWHCDKLDKFKGTTILLSHHQLFSANSSLTDGATPWLNSDLNRTFSPYFDRIGAWFWGHEHNYVIFKDGQFGLKKGRLLGCSAYEESKDEDPYKNKYPDNVAYVQDMKQVDLSPYQGDVGKYYNHAMALLEVSPAKIDVSYYQFPSWGMDFTPPQADEPSLLLKETIVPTPPPA